MKKIFMCFIFLFLLSACTKSETGMTDDTVNNDNSANDELSVVDNAILQDDDKTPVSDTSEADGISISDEDYMVETPDEELDETPDEDIDTVWSPVLPHTEQQGKWTIVWLSGTPYEMGFQHGQLLHEQIKKGMADSQYIKDLKWQISLAGTVGLDNFASLNSYPDIKQECEGMVASAGDVGWTMEICFFVNFGDVMVEFLSGVMPAVSKLKAPGCSQMMVTGSATADGRMYHGRLLDWGEVDYLLWFPTIFVRQPSDGIPHTYIGFPGNLSPYSGMNVAGLSMASNESDPFDSSQHDYVGHSHVQMLGQLMKKAHSLDEAISIIQGENHMSVEQFGIADSKLDRAAVFEMTATAVGIREMTDDALWMTNHFVAEETKNLDIDPTGDSTRRRFMRFSQLLPKDGSDSRHGTFNPTEIVKVLRDRINPETSVESPVGTFDDDSSIATNGAIYAIVFDPASLHFWVAAGTMPVPEQQFDGFSLGTLLKWPGAKPVDPKVLP